MDTTNATNPGQENLSNVSPQIELNASSETKIFSSQTNSVCKISPTKQDSVTYNTAVNTLQQNSDTTQKTIDTSQISPLSGQVITAHLNLQQKEVVTQPSGDQPVFLSRQPQTLNNQLPDKNSLHGNPEQRQNLPQQNVVSPHLNSPSSSEIQPTPNLSHQSFQLQTDQLQSTNISPLKVPSSQVSSLKKEPQEQKISQEKSIASLSGQTVLLKSASLQQNSSIVLSPINSTKMNVSQLESNSSSTKSEPNVAEPTQDIKPLLTTDNDKKQMSYILQFLKEKGLSGTLNSLQKEANITPESLPQLKSQVLTGDSSNSLTSAEVSSLFSAYSNESDPSSYEDNYRVLQQFIDGVLDTYKFELSQFLYPVFIHMYLELIYNNHIEKAESFMKSFGNQMETYYEDNMSHIRVIKSKHQMENSCFVRELRKMKYIVKISTDSNQQLKHAKNMPLVQNVLSRYISIETYEGRSRNKIQIDSASGGLHGEAGGNENKTKVLFGLLKEPDIEIPMEEEEDMVVEDGDLPKPTPKKRKRPGTFARKSKNDPNAPPVGRIPLPELRDAGKAELVMYHKESLKRLKLSDSTKPSVVMYTITNSYDEVTCATISDDSSLMAAGFHNSDIIVWSLNKEGLKELKKYEELNELDKEDDDILNQIMDKKSSVEKRTLKGHKDVVYGVSISPCRRYLVSCSADEEVRLWSLQIWTSLISYKGHLAPVWDVQFSPFGQYFVSCGADRTARLWSMDHFTPLRIFAGHLSDVDCVCFHPNCNYIATGSSDNAVRVFDLKTGESCRMYTGHKKRVLVVRWAPDGRLLASGGADGHILVFDIVTKQVCIRLNAHVGPIYTLCFSRDGECIASGGADDSTRVWNFQRALAEFEAGTGRGLGHFHQVTNNKSNQLLISDLATKSTKIVFAHFTRTNVLLNVGKFVKPQDQTEATVAVK